MPTEVRSEIAATLLPRFRSVRSATLEFTAPLSPEDMMVQSCADASPVKWHLAHTSWFFEVFVLTPYAPGYKAFHPEFHWLFNSYYTSLGDMPAKNLRSSFSRPPLADILAYRAHVDAAVENLLAWSPAEHEQDILRRVVLGLEHEQQHLELAATDIKHAFFTNPLHPAYLAEESNHPPAARSLSFAPMPTDFTDFAGGLTQVGITPNSDDPMAFAFDNETPRHTVFLQPFSIANRLVTVAEYLAFIDDNGYTRPELWLSEGWTTMRAGGWQAPAYWQRSAATPSGWEIFTLGGFRCLAELVETPVCHVSLFEADAFARWSGMRLPTEFEWEHACANQATLIRGEDLLCYPGDTSQAAVKTATTANLLERNRFHPVAAAATSQLQQMYGDVWEWTSSGYTGYPGYRPLPGALGEYNGKFMSSQVILRGGSALTPATHIRVTYRNFFPPSMRGQMSGIRLAKDL